MKNTLFNFVATTDERTSCDLCGRDELKMTVVLKDNETNEFVFYGSQCAAKAMGWTVKDVKKSATSEDKEYQKKARAHYRSHKNHELVQNEVEECNKQNVPGFKRPMVKWNEMEVEAKEDTKKVFPFAKRLY